MKPCLRLLCISILGLFAATASAQVTTAEEDRALFMEALEQQSKAKVCSARIPDFGDKFKPAFLKWKIKHEAILRTGDAFIRTEAVKERVTIEEKVSAATREVTQRMEADSLMVLQEKCKAVLLWVGAI
ncbi:MAG TPA: hypothetical protein VL381_10235 [Rhodocyclaceae bacterium]|jgi:hypothetical protein|nr:hypothetical protein [Rhodocyclaceae bacterium]